MNWIAYMLMGLATALFQVSLPASFLPLDFPLLLAVFAGLQRGGTAGLLCGGSAGIALDLMVGPQVGLRFASLSFVGAASDSLGLRANLDQPRLKVLAAAGLSLAHDMLLAGMAERLLISQGGWKRILLQYALPRMALHAALALPFYAGFKRLVRSRVFRRPEEQAVVVLRKLPR